METKKQIFTAKTVAEAINLAQETLKVEINYTDVIVMNPGRPGILGLGGQMAKIEVPLKDSSIEKPRKTRSKSTVASAKGSSKKKSTAVNQNSAMENQTIEIKKTAAPQEYSKEAVTEEEANTVTTIVSKFLDVLGFNYELFLNTDQANPHLLQFEIESKAGGGHLIGEKGSNLQALEFLTRLFTKKLTGRYIEVLIDVENYRERRKVYLIEAATRIASRVAKEGGKRSMKPMPASERRIVHRALAGNKFVKTYSTGGDDQRKLIIESTTKGIDA